MIDWSDTETYISNKNNQNSDLMSSSALLKESAKLSHLEAGHKISRAKEGQKRGCVCVSSCFCLRKKSHQSLQLCYPSTIWADHITLNSCHVRWTAFCHCLYTWGWQGGKVFASEEKTGQKHCKPTYQIPHTVNWHVKKFYRGSTWEIAMRNVS